MFASRTTHRACQVDIVKALGSTGAFASVWKECTAKVQYATEQPSNNEREVRSQSNAIILNASMHFLQTGGVTLFQQHHTEPAGRENSFSDGSRLAPPCRPSPCPTRKEKRGGRKEGAGEALVRTARVLGLRRTSFKTRDWEGGLIGAL